MRYKLIPILVLLMVCLNSLGQEKIWIKPNQGQWNEEIKFNVLIPGGDLILRDQGFTYYFHNGSEILHNHKDLDHPNQRAEESKRFIGHIVKTTFLGANNNPEFIESSPSKHYENYFFGSDSSKWVNNLTLYNRLIYKDLYSGINLDIYQNNEDLKYDIHIAPNTNSNQFKVLYEGQDSISITNRILTIYTSRGEIFESAPIAYQYIGSYKKEIECNYKLEGDTVSFIFPKGYSTDLELIIDPVLTFSTFTGATADNWGNTACSDADGLLIAGGIIFSPISNQNFPTTSGAFDRTYNGGAIDIGITKFNSTGSGLVFSTYIGGNGSETPHSIITNDANEIYLMGTTSSTNLPLGTSSFQTVNRRGSTQFVLGIEFNGGTDIYALKLNKSGTSVLGGTYIGGTNNDGISNISNSLAYNYGDELRGEIILDKSSNVYITSSTYSSNFPIVNGFDSNLGGSQDAVIIKLNSTLNNLLYSSYIGGTALESGNSVQVSNTGDIFVVGGTTSSNFPFTSGQYQTNYAGGKTDGYVIRLQAPNYNSVKATYLGTNSYDQAYLVQLNKQNKVFIFGQSSGNYPVTSGKYVNINSGQFIHKLSNDLSTSEWSSVFGASVGDVEISPTAFLVSDCDDIYVSGWGGEVNISHQNALKSTTRGFPITGDAYQKTTSGSNFWIGIFKPEMTGLKYATFMGSLNGAVDHVDGGTSRFTKDGKIYHAVCAGCQGNSNGFPTTPNAYSTTNKSTNCNLAAFLFELSQIDAILSTTTPITCIPNATQFVNKSVNGDVFKWYFGDGDSSSLANPSHAYQAPGIYTVTLIVSDKNNCFIPDTVLSTVEIISPNYDAYPERDTICPGEDVKVFAFGGDSYKWSPATLFDNNNQRTPIVSITQDTTVTVTIQNDCGTINLSFRIHLYETFVDAGQDKIICKGDDIQLNGIGIGTYSWSPIQSLSNPNIPNPIASPTSTLDYILKMSTSDGCIARDTMHIQVDLSLPIPDIVDQTTVCKGFQKQIIASGATSYKWYPQYNITSTTIANPFVYPIVDTIYYIDFMNACGVVIDSVIVNVSEVTAIVRPDTIVCPKEPINLWAKGGLEYFWYPKTRIENPSVSNTVARPFVPTNYKVVVINEFGCSDTAKFFADIYDPPKLSISSTVYVDLDEQINIWAKGEGNITWQPKNLVECFTCPETEVYGKKDMYYTATLTNDNGCTTEGIVKVYFRPIVYVPNIFTPDNDSYNNEFKAVIQNVKEFEMLIYNRWGEIVFQSFDQDSGWNGFYGGDMVQDGVYIWAIFYTDAFNNKFDVRGHVTLLR